MTAAGAASQSKTRLYDPATNTWSSLPPMPGPRTSGTPVVLGDGSTLLIGGHVETADGWSPADSLVRFVPGS